MKRLKLHNVLACEYVALGAHSKHTLVNVYSGDIVVRELPATFPLSFYIEFSLDSADQSAMTIEVMQGSNQRAKVELEFEYEQDKLGLLVLPPLPLTFTEETEIKLIASGPNISRTTVLQKKVSLGEIPGL